MIEITVYIFKSSAKNSFSHSKESHKSLINSKKQNRYTPHLPVAYYISVHISTAKNTQIGYWLVAYFMDGKKFR